MTTMTTTESMSRIAASAESIVSDKTQRFPDAATPGDVFRQGDVYIELLEGVPSDCVRAKEQNPQLAPGTTKGSRHILNDLDAAVLYERRNATVLNGPVVEVKSEVTVTHPEHGDVVLPTGVYDITYQRQYAEELRRVAD